MNAPTPPTADKATRRASRFRIIAGGLDAPEPRHPRHARAGSVEFKWTADEICHSPGEFNCTPQRPPGRGWRIADAGRDRRTLWMRRPPCDGGHR